MIRKAARMKSEAAEKLPRNINTSKLQAALISEVHFFDGKPLNEIVQQVLERDFGIINPSTEVIHYGACVCLWQLFKQLMIGSEVRKLVERGTFADSEMEDLRKQCTTIFDIDVAELRQVEGYCLKFRTDTDLSEEHVAAVHQNYRKLFDSIGLEYFNAPEQHFVLASIVLAASMVQRHHCKPGEEAEVAA